MTLHRANPELDPRVVWFEDDRYEPDERMLLDQTDLKPLRVPLLHVARVR